MTTPPIAARPRRPIWMRLIFSAVTMMLLLGSLEMLVRWTNADRALFPAAFEDPYETANQGWWRLMTYDPVLYWRGRPFGRLPGTNEFLNERGFRGSDFRDAKPPGIARVVCMGDSATFGLVNHGGFRITYTPTYSSELQDVLNTDIHQKVQVINAGIIGYSTSEGLRLLKHEVRHWGPDLITIRYGVNDHLRKSNDYRPDFESHNPIVRWGTDQLLDLRTYQLLTRIKNSQQTNTVAAAAPVGAATTPGLAAKPKQPAAPVTKFEVRVPLPNFEYNLRRLVTVGRAAGAQVVLITAPLAPPFPEIISDKVTLAALGYPTYDALLAEHRRYEDVVRKVAVDLDAPLVDGSRDLVARGLEQFFTHHDIGHPNGDGHIAIAQGIAALIKSKHLLP